MARLCGMFLRSKSPLDLARVSAHYTAKNTQHALFHAYASSIFFCIARMDSTGKSHHFSYIHRMSLLQDPLHNVYLKWQSARLISAIYSDFSLAELEVVEIFAPTTAFICHVKRFANISLVMCTHGVTVALTHNLNMVNLPLITFSDLKSGT